MSHINVDVSEIGTPAEAPAHQPSTRNTTALMRWSVLGVAVWAFLWNCITGHLGLFAADQSIVFDGGWRIASGQVPFKDFIMAFGPITFVLQAAFFKLLGVTWTAMVVAAATANTVAALSTMRIVVLLFGSRQLSLVIASGILMGASFQAVFGTLWMEQVAFLFGLLAIQAICESLEHRHSLVAWSLFAGVLLGLSVLSKQNVGTLLIPVVVACCAAATLNAPRAMLTGVISVIAGFALSIGLFAAWLVLFADPHLFVRHAIEVPAQLGRSRVAYLWQTILFPPQLLSFIPGTTQWCIAVALGCAFYTAFCAVVDPISRNRLWSSARLRVALVLTTCTPFVQCLFQVTTNNEDANVLFLSGMSLCLGIGLACLAPSRPENRPWLFTLMCIVGTFLLFEMLYRGWNREVHDIFPRGAALSRSLNVPPLANLRWLTPTLRTARHTEQISAQEIEDVCSYLRDRKQTFVVLGEASYLYGVAGVIPPQPLLYFSKDHFYTNADIPRIDEWVLSGLKRHDVRFVVQEQNSTNGYFPLPQSKQWVKEHFRPGPVFGNFHILIR